MMNEALTLTFVLIDMVLVINIECLVRIHRHTDLADVSIDFSRLEPMPKKQQDINMMSNKFAIVLFTTGCLKPHHQYRIS